MNKENIGSYLWILITVIIMLCLLAFASPFGVYVKNNLEQFTGEFIEKESEQGTPKTEYYDLHIEYDTADSGVSLPDVDMTLKKYEQYNVPSPEVKGYVPDIAVVEGTITEDISYTVTYSRGNYSITYVTNGGVWKDSLLNAEGKLISDYTSYEYGTGVTLLNTPVDTNPPPDDLTKENMHFLGWYETEDFKGEHVDEIKSTDYGNKIFYAKWSSNKYIINYVLNDTIDYDSQNDRYIQRYYYCENENKAGSIAEWDSVVTDAKGHLKPEFTEYTYGSQFKLPTTLHKFGYTFIGWSEIANGEDVKGNYRTQITETDKGNITLYAHWERNTYTITYHTDFIRPTGEKVSYKIKDTKYTVLDSYGNTTEYNGYPKTYKYGDTIKVLPASLELVGYDKIFGTRPWKAVWYNKPTDKITITPGGEDVGTVQGYPEDAIQKGSVSPVTEGFVIGIDSDHPKYDHTNLDLYVRPVPDTYEVEFVSNIIDENGNTSKYTKANISSYSQWFLYDEVKPLTKNKFTANGRTFMGWNTKSDGTGTPFTDSQIVTNLTEFDTNGDGKITLYAQWALHHYNVEYDLNHKNNETTTPHYANPGSYPKTATYDSPFEVTNPVRDGYTFMGWKVISGLNISTGLYGTKTQIEQGDPKVKPNSTAIRIDSADKICKTNDNNVWFVNLTTVNNGTVKLQAQWEANGTNEFLPKTFIEYDLNRPSTATSRPFFGSKHPLRWIFDQDLQVDNPHMTGYEFTGWTITGCYEDDGNIIKTDLDTDIDHYYGNKVFSVVNKEVKTEDPLAIQTRDSELTDITATHFINLRKEGGILFTANWKPITYNIEYDLNWKDNESTKPMKIKSDPYPTTATYDQDFMVGGLIRTGYRFDGWSITGMDTVRHYYSENPIKVTNHTVTEGTHSTYPNTGFPVSSDIKYFMNLHSNQGATVKFTAMWTPIRYYIDYNLNETVTTDKAYLKENEKWVYGTRFDRNLNIPNPLRDNYQFNGWNITDIISNINGYYGNTDYVVSNKTISPKTTAINDKTSLNGVFETKFINLRDGTINHKDKDNNKETSRVKFTANWKPNIYKIILDKQGGEKGSDNVYEKYGVGYYKEETCIKQITKIDIPQKANYTFKGYYDKENNQCIDENGNIVTNNTFFNINNTTNGETTIYAKWEPNIYKITLDNQGGRGNDAIYEKYSTGFYTDSNCSPALKITKVPTPKKLYYSFEGYYTGINGTGAQCIDRYGNIIVSNTYFNNDNTIDGETTIYAKWEPNVYKITLDKQGGDSGSDDFYEKYDIGYYKENTCVTQITKINSPQKTGYTFNGYYTEKNGTGKQCVDEHGNITTESNTYFTKNTTIYAKWTPNTYKITYNLDGGSHGSSHPETATYDKSFTVSNPTKNKYNFTGWKITGMDECTHTYGGSTTTGTTINSTKATTFKNLRSKNGTVTFTAQWKAVHTCEWVTVQGASGCTKSGGKYKYLTCTSSACPLKNSPDKKVQVIDSVTSGGLGHRPTGLGTCRTHHHTSKCWSNSSYEHTWDWGWTCSWAHDKCDGADDIIGFSDQYCARKTPFKDNGTCQRGGNGFWYCGTRRYSLCYLDGGFYQIAQYRFDCGPGGAWSSSGKIYDYFADKIKDKKQFANIHAVYRYIIDNHNNCSGYTNCCTKDKCYGKHRSNGYS